MLTLFIEITAFIILRFSVKSTEVYNNLYFDDIVIHKEQHIYYSLGHQEV